MAYTWRWAASLAPKPTLTDKPTTDEPRNMRVFRGFVPAERTKRKYRRTTMSLSPLEAAAKEGTNNERFHSFHGLLLCIRAMKLPRDSVSIPHETLGNSVCFRISDLVKTGRRCDRRRHSNTTSFVFVGTGCPFAFCSSSSSGSRHRCCQSQWHRHSHFHCD